MPMKIKLFFKKKKKKRKKKSNDPITNFLLSHISSSCMKVVQQFIK
jgi:hypothetical protein